MVEPVTLATPTGLKARVRKAVGKLEDTSYRTKAALLMSATTLAMSVTPTFCASSLDGVVNSLLSFIFSLARVVGVIIAANGVFNWVLANKDENADGQARGIKFVVCGLALVFLKDLADPILQAVGF